MTSHCQECGDEITDGATWCDPCASQDDPPDDDLDPADMAKLEADLAELERTDPAVARAAARYRRTTWRLANRPNHHRQD